MPEAFTNNYYKNYELSVLLDKTLDDDGLQAAISAIEEYIRQLGGTIFQTEDDGIKQIAYPIRNQDAAHYLFFAISLPLAAPSILEKWLNAMDDILRYLLVVSFEEYHTFYRTTSTAERVSA